MAEQQQSLAELCGICYTEKPKYRCPRCKTQTCSLPCYKRHQQRASCNGQRDPAAYVKKSAWATPAGIDHDYNYLKSVERSVDRAGQDISERGLGRRHNASTSDKRIARAQAPGSALHTYLVEHGIQVERAPMGMSRQKANRTRTTNRGNIMWTVEWYDAHGESITNDDNEAARPLSDLWAETMSVKRNAESGIKRDRKRKRGPNAKSQGEISSEAFKPDDKAPIQSSRKSKSRKNPEEDSVVNDSHPTTRETPSETTRDAEISADPSDPAQMEPGQPQDGSMASHTPAKESPPETEKPHHFYLLKPLTASNTKVMIRLDSALGLTRCLANRTILEYPTVYVLNAAPDALPEGFVLETTYEKQQRSEQREVDGLLKEAQQSGAAVGTTSQQEEKPLDAGSILDMLQRDIGM